MVGVALDAPGMTGGEGIIAGMAPLWGALLGFVLGGLLGLVHFGTLRHVTRLYTDGGAIWRAVALQGARLVVLVGVMVFLARQGAGPLLAGALGLLLARSVVVRWGRHE